MNPEPEGMEKLLTKDKFGRLITFDDEPPTTDDGLKSDSYSGEAVPNCELLVPTLLLIVLLVKLCNGEERLINGVLCENKRRVCN